MRDEDVFGNLLSHDMYVIAKIAVYMDILIHARVLAVTTCLTPTFCRKNGGLVVSVSKPHRQNTASKTKARCAHFGVGFRACSTSVPPRRTGSA